MFAEPPAEAAAAPPVITAADLQVQRGALCLPWQLGVEVAVDPPLSFTRAAGVCPQPRHAHMCPSLPLPISHLQAGRSAGHKTAPGAAGGKGTGAAAMPTVKLLDLGMACLYDPAKPQRGERRMVEEGHGW